MIEIYSDVEAPERSAFKDQSAQHGHMLVVLRASRGHRRHRDVVGWVDIMNADGGRSMPITPIAALRVLSLGIADPEAIQSSTGAYRDGVRRPQITMGKESTADDEWNSY